MPSIKCIYDKDYVLYQSKGKTLIQRPCECFVIHVYAASGPLHYNRSIHTHTRGVPRIWEGGGQDFFFSDLGICKSRSDMLRMASPYALLGGFGGMLPRENFLKRCNLVRFRVYFDQILSLFFSKNAIFYLKNKYFRYTFVMGYFSCRSF